MPFVLELLNTHVTVTTHFGFKIQIRLLRFRSENSCSNLQVFKSSSQKKPLDCT